MAKPETIDPDIEAPWWECERCGYRGLERECGQCHETVWPPGQARRSLAFRKMIAVEYVDQLKAGVDTPVTI